VLSTVVVDNFIGGAVEIPLCAEIVVLPASSSHMFEFKSGTTKTKNADLVIVMFKGIMITGCVISDKITHFDNSDFCDNVITSNSVITYHMITLSLHVITLSPRLHTGCGKSSCDFLNYCI
jgi:hypothetical protein